MNDPDSQNSPGSSEPEKNPLIAAAHYLGAGTAAMCQSGESRRHIFEEEKSLLREWCARNGCELVADVLSGCRPVSSGAEHDVFFSDSENRAIKLTRSGGFGHSLVQEGKSALPSEYLLRLIYQNELFGDFIEFQGIISGETGVQILTSQPWITAHPENPTPSDLEIDNYFESLGFKRRENLPVAAYYNVEMDLAVLDAHAQNILRDERGDLVPIDLVIGQPGEWTRKWLGL